MDENTEVATVEPTDEQVNEFFESGGTTDLEAPAVETKEEVKPEVKAEPAKEKMVPHGALHEERERRKELQNKVQAMESRFQQFQEAMTQRANPPPPIPTVEQDAVGHFAARMEQMERQNQAFLNRAAQQDQQNQAMQAQNNVINLYQQSAQTFSKDTPDFTDAYGYYKDGRVNELMAIGLNQQQAIETFRTEEFNIALKCLNEGMNPAEKLYQAAQVRGYAKKAQENTESKLETVAKGQKAAKLNGTSANSSGKVSLEALASMDDDEFLAQDWDKLIRQA